MAELLLSAVLQVLFDRLASRELLNFANREKVRDLVKKWETKLRNISVLLEDAEDKAMRGSDRRVQPWLDDLKDLAYDIEDVVDEFVTREGIRSTLSKEADASGSRSIAGKCLLPSCCTGLSPRKLMFDRELRSRMEKIDGRLDFILEQKRDLGLNEGGGSMKKESYSYARMTDSLPEHYVVGRQEDERVILAKLLMQTDDCLSVIPIIGMGGVGKTTLARSVFNNPAVVAAFPKRGWVCVSDNFNIVEIARALLGSLTEGGIVDSSDLNVLHNKLREILSKEKFLIVLDDYWNEDYNDWDRLFNLYRLGVKGSKIIVTTRLQKVVSMMNAGQDNYHLGELSPGDCLSLLAYHALGCDNFDTHSHLKTVGEKIADKCGGLPLAAKTLGGLLRSKSNTREWQDILNSEIWDLPQGKDGIFPALKLSYFHLPSHLKRCFAFCAIFPQDYEFDRDYLVLLWMAEDLLDMGCQNLQRSMLDRGRQHFDELLNRSFFQRSTQDESRFVMHDLMHDLATVVGGSTCFNVGSGGFDDGRCTFPKRVRHLSYIPEYYEVSTRLEKCHIFKGLRTFLALMGNDYESCLSNKVAEELLQKLKYFRALSLSKYTITVIPNCIGHLKHLRFLDFSGNLMRELPESICTLYNLETLILNRCYALKELPPGMNKLINLSCLDIRSTTSLKKMPLGLFHLHKLEILPKFIVGREDGLRLKELQHLQNLHGELVISNLQNVREVGDARDANLEAKVNLTTLALQWDVDSGNLSSRTADNEMEVMRFLQPHPNIDEVKIYGYGGKSFPPWIGSPSLVNIKHIQLDGCENIRTLPSLGLLPSLKKLVIIKMNGVCTVGPEFFGNVARPFPSLEVLIFHEMRAWEAWSFSFGDKQIEEPFPRLNKLKVRKCPKLIVGWLHRLHSLVQLEIEDCPLLKASSSTTELSLLKEVTLTSCNHEVVAGISSTIQSSLSKISLTNIQGLEYLNGDILGSLSAVESLEIIRCDGLRWLWEDDVEAVQSLARLKSLCIRRCANLEKLPNNMQRLTSLRELNISTCSKLEYVPDGMMNCSSLEMLSIIGCGSLICFPEGATLPTTMRSLEIQNCEKLETLPEGIIKTYNGDTWSSKDETHLHLENLDIQDCPSLKPLIGSDKKQGMQLAPTSLKTLLIFDSGAVLDCLLDEINFHEDGNIKSITHRLHMFTCLTELSLHRCLSLECDVFPELPSSLKSLSLVACDKIKSLPHGMHTSTSLQELQLYGLSIESFPEGGLPLSLETLEVGDCMNLRQPMAEWGLHNLTALKGLAIKGEIGCLCLPGHETTCFPPPPPSRVQAASSDWSLLPPNIERLVIDQPNMVSLSNGMRGHLNFLQELSMFSCRKLRFLPKEGFPPSLGYLWIKECSRDLQRECSKGGAYFPLIERIPRWELEMDS